MNNFIGTACPELFDDPYPFSSGGGDLPGPPGDAEDGLPWEIVKVFTRYDTWRPLVIRELNHLYREWVDYHLKWIEEGLEGVKYYHYRQSPTPG